MTSISLRAYNREIENLIEQGQRLDEAVAHCLHILRSYPKHLETYRLLGKAYLEAKRYEQAVDIFQRVLVATPEDFVSHVGMSIIADDQAKLDDAIWHMERAFEVQPSNAAIQAELQRLFGRRDGVEPPKIRLTRGALAHMYVQGDLYVQAISEIRAVLTQDQNRTDMQVLLARAYSRNGQKAEAAEVCSALLAISPYCLDANRLMAELTPVAQNAEAAREYRRRVVELDPYAEYAKGPDLSSDSVPDGQVMLQRLEYTGAAYSMAAPIEVSLGNEVGSTKSPGEAPDWISGTSRRADEAPPSPAAEVHVPDFMRDAGWQETAPGMTGESAAESMEETAATPAELPEWVRALAPGEELEGAGSAQAPELGVPDWLNESTAPASMAPEMSEGTSFATGTPDWLRDLGMPSEDDRAVAEQTPAPESEPVSPLSKPVSGSPEAQVPADDDGLAWLERLAEKHGAKPDQLLTDPLSRPSTPPSWIDGGGAVPEVASSGEAPAEEKQASKQGDWMTGLADQNAFAEMEQGGEAADEPILDEGDATRWATQTDQPGIGGTPAWLEDRMTRPDDADSTAGRGGAEAPESAADLPNWLAGLDGEKGAPAQTPPATAESGQLPDWLQGDNARESQGTPMERAAWHAAEPEQPAETSTGDDAREAESVASLEEVMPAVTQPAPSEVPQAVHRPSPEPIPRTVRSAVHAGGPGLPPVSVARAELGRGNIGAALDLYGRLIRKGRSLEEIIRDLRDALYRYPVEVPIWQALGDAYMRANRLQEALDAYTKAEELLR